MFTSSEHLAPTFPLSLPEAQIAFAYNGSAALYQAAQDLALCEGDLVLLPAYCCGAEISPFEHIGCELLFYDSDEMLQANVEHIEQSIKQGHDIKAVLITHYFGFAQKDTVRIKKLCEKSNIALIEDCAHSLYSKHNDKPLGSFGSHAIFSPRKFLPLTEGGLCIVNNVSRTLSTASKTKPPDFAPSLQRVLYSLQQFYRSDNEPKSNKALACLSIGVWGIPAVILKLLKRTGLFKRAIWLTADAEGEEAVAIYNVSMSKRARTQLLKENMHDVIAKRRNNYYYLLQEFSEENNDTQATVLFPMLPDDCCPLYFPLRVSNPALIVEALKLDDIESFNWWQHMHGAVDWDLYPCARKMKQSIVALPVHQKLGSAQIKRIADSVKAAMNNQK